MKGSQTIKPKFKVSCVAIYKVIYYFSYFGSTILTSKIRNSYNRRLQSITTANTRSQRYQNICEAFKLSLGHKRV